MEAWVRALRAFWSSDARALPWLWAHGDFTPYNLVYRDRLPVALLDFGAAQWAPAAYDVAVALLGFPAAHSDFLAAYESVRPLCGAERAALPSLMRHRRVVAVLWIAEQVLAGREDLREKLGIYLTEP
jgi:Ser/Thr protein kinase RdoA (MazF antagonist)